MTNDQVNALDADALARAVEQYVFGSDLSANTIDKQLTAVNAWLATKANAYMDDGWISFDWPPPCRAVGFSEKCSVVEFVGKSIGKPWEESMREFVAQWRASPPTRTVADLMRREKGTGVLLRNECVSENEAFAAFTGPGFYAYGASPEEALMRALLVRYFKAGDQPV